MMTRRTPHIRSWLTPLLFAAALTSILPTTAAAKALPTVPPVTLSGAWTSVGLPDAPLDVVAHDGQLWVSGANEMIAESSDGGRTWTLRNQRRHGEDLFVIRFPGGNKIDAFGSAGVWLSSGNGGHTWTRRVLDAQLGISLAEMSSHFVVAASAQHFTYESLDSTAPWRLQFVPLPKDPHAKAAPSGRSVVPGAFVEQVSALNKRQAMVLFAAADKGQIVAVTSDGGNSWRTAKLSGFRWTGLRSAGGKFVLYGRAGTAASLGRPAIARSRDGQHWSVDAAAPSAAYSQCEVQGCLVPGGWVDLTGPTPAYWQLPLDPGEPKPGNWAAAGDTFCFVRDVLRCRTGRTVWVAGHHPKGFDPDAPGLKAPEEISTPDPTIPEAARDSGAHGYVMLEGVIGIDGRVRKIMVLAAPRADLAQAALALLKKKWRFKPATDHGTPVAVPANFLVDCQLYPDR